MKIENRNFKDTVFRMLFNDKKRLLELYNALNKTSYDNPETLVIKTLKGMTFLGMKNDVSFIIDDELNLYEHNSTPCPNIPLRFLFYIASSLRKLVPLKDTYKDESVEIPAPRFLVFYNGTAPLPDKIEYKLSDMYKKEMVGNDLELHVTVLNVNEGRNKELMESCRTMKEYSIFVAKVRKYRQETKRKHSKDYYTENKLSLIEADVTRAIDECIEENILRDFFIAHRKEAIDVSILDCTAEEQYQVIADENLEKGIRIGVTQGITQTNSLYSWLFSNNRADDVQRASMDSEYLNKLFDEYNENKAGKE